MPSQVKSEPMSQAINPVVEMGYEEEQYEDYSQEYGQETGQGYEGGVLSGGAEGNKGKPHFAHIPQLIKPKTKRDRNAFCLKCEKDGGRGDWANSY